MPKSHSAWFRPTARQRALSARALHTKNQAKSLSQLDYFTYPASGMKVDYSDNKVA